MRFISALGEINQFKRVNTYVFPVFTGRIGSWWHLTFILLHVMVFLKHGYVVLVWNAVFYNDTLIKSVNLKKVVMELAYYLMNHYYTRWVIHDILMNFGHRQLTTMFSYNKNGCYLIAIAILFISHVYLKSKHCRHYVYCSQQNIRYFNAFLN